jgi:hypothetical protein
MRNALQMGSSGFKMKIGFDLFEVYRYDPASTVPAELFKDVIFAII